MDRKDNRRINDFSPRGFLLVLDSWGCEFGLLNSPEFLLTHAIAAAKMTGMQVLADLIIPFSPQGFTIVQVLSESHLTIHTAPECSYAGIDIFTCGKGNPEIACEYLIGVLKPEHVISKRFARGMIQSNIDEDSENEKEVEIYAER